jgi:hypothetical protein
MADEKRSFATNTASSNRSDLQGGGNQEGQPIALEDAVDVDAVEADVKADEDAAIASRKAEADRFQGAKTRQATKDIISRRT